MVPELERVTAFLGAGMVPAEVRDCLGELLPEPPSRTAIQYLLTTVSQERQGSGQVGKRRGWATDQSRRALGGENGNFGQRLGGPDGSGPAARELRAPGGVGRRQARLAYRGAFHRDGKHHLGMGDGQLRSGEGQTRHRYLVMLDSNAAACAGGARADSRFSTCESMCNRNDGRLSGVGTLKRLPRNPTRWLRKNAATPQTMVFHQNPESAQAQAPGSPGDPVGSQERQGSGQVSTGLIPC